MKKILKRIIQLYLKILTRIVLFRHKPLIVAIAGTTNKTFVKERILDELGRGSKVRGNPKSFNTEIGLPLAVLFLPSGYSSIFRWVDVLLAGTTISFFSCKFPKVLVLEFGIDRKGDMKYLLSMIKPDIAVITNVEKSFPDQHTSLDDLAEEFSFLIKAVPKQGLVILNGEDVRIRKLSHYAQSRVVTFGQGKDFTANISQVVSDDVTEKFHLKFDQINQQYQTEHRGKHNIQAQAIAIIIGQKIKS